MNILDNVKHLPSSISGGVIAVLGIVLAFTDPLTPTGAFLQQLAAGHAKLAAGLTLVTSLALIFGVGPKK